MVKSKDSQGYPKSASLKVGYSKFGIEEDWDSNVHCDPAKGTIEAKSSDLASNGLFEVLKTKWEVLSIIPEGSPEAAAKEPQTSVKLDIEVKFRNAVYDQMFSQVEGKVASAMIAAFEQRVSELDRKS
jgi:coenzyme Q-binding protein COQ10